MIAVLSERTDPGRADKPNEDGMGAVGRFAWVIDGATGLGDERLLPGPSDAAWLTAVLNEAMHAAAKTAETPEALMRAGVVEAERRYLAERSREPLERYEIPTAAVLVLMVREADIAVADLGDCSVYLDTGSGPPLRFGGTEAGRALEKANASKLMSAGGGRSPEVLSFLRTVRNLANAPDGYPIVAPDARSADMARRHIVPARNVDALLMTDGLEAAIEDYGLYDAAGLIHAARGGLDVPLGRLRQVERDDPDCVQFPRFKPSDDATGLLVRVGDGATPPA